MLHHWVKLCVNRWRTSEVIALTKEKWNLLHNLPTIAYGAWTARGVSVPAVMNQMVTRDNAS